MFTLISEYIKRKKNCASGNGKSHKVTPFICFICFQAIAIAGCFMSEGPILVVCPAILRFSWAEEIERWLPSCLPSEIHLGIGFLPLSFYFYSCFCFASFLLGWVLEVGESRVR